MVGAKNKKLNKIKNLRFFVAKKLIFVTMPVNRKTAALTGKKGV
jgi:hypothetical protein